MMRRVFASLLFAALFSAGTPAATLETRQHTSLAGSVSFAAKSITVTEAGGQQTTVPFNDVVRLSFLDAPKTTTFANAPWNSADIGEVYLPGSTLATNATLSLTASGWGMWRDADGLRLASVPLVGNGELIARVEHFDETGGAVLAGLSIRESLGPRARHISLLQSSRGTLALRARSDDGFAHRTLPVERTNGWMRLSRSGTQLAAYLSDDGKSWSPVEGVSINTTNILRAGIFVCTEVNAALGTAWFRDVVLREGTQARERGELPAPALVLRDGTVLAGNISATNDTVRFVRAGVSRDFNIHGLAALLFRPVAAQLALQPAIAPTTGVVMNDRDWLEGEVREFTPHGIVLATVLFGAKTVRWADHPAAVVLGGRTDTANWEIILKDGSQIRAKDFVMAGTGGVAHTAALAEFPFTLAELLEIRSVKP